MSRYSKPQGTLVKPVEAPRWRDDGTGLARPPKRPFEDHTNRNDPKGKGKGKAVQELVPTVEACKEAGALLGHSFHVHRLSHLHSFLLGTSVSSFSTFAKQLKLYLAQQLALGGDSELNLGGGDPSITRVEAGYVDVGLHDSGRRPILIEVDRGASEESRTTSLFVLLPASASSHYPILLTKTTYPALATLFITYLSTRHDTFITSLRIPPPSMLSLFESLVQGRDTSFDDDPAARDTIMHTTATFAFPEAIAREGLGALTLTLPPALLAALCTPSCTFLDTLGAYFQSVTALTLSQLCLVRLGAGRGTFIHSGQGSEGGAKIKLYKKAGEEGELESVLQHLVRVAETGR